MTGNFPYTFHQGESGLFVEIYLPKKAHYQGRLYETLTNGFKENEVKKHFEDQEKRPDIIALLREHYPEFDGKKIDEFCARYECDSFKRIYAGYSMYEVDGVFFDYDKPKNEQISEERTQIIRPMFRPDLADFDNLERERLITLTKTFFRAPLSRVQYYEEYVSKSHSIQGLTGDEHNLIRYLEEFVQRVIIFIIGYILYNICNEIKELVSKTQLPKHEDEIWVTSFWNLLIHRVVYKSE